MKRDFWLCNWHLICGSIGTLLMIATRAVYVKSSYGNTIQPWTRSFTDHNMNDKTFKYKSQLKSFIEAWKATNNYAIKRTKHRQILSFEDKLFTSNSGSTAFQNIEEHKPNLHTYKKSTVTTNYTRLKMSLTDEHNNSAAETKSEISESENMSTRNPFFNKSQYDKEMYIKYFNNLSLQKQLNIDFQQAYLCMMFIILMMILGVWCTGICRSRKHTFIEVDFASSQPLTVVKDVVLRKSKYLPMFRDFYYSRYTVDRSTDP